MNKRILLIYPPHTRNVEPPIGIALLASALTEQDIPTRCLDLNVVCGTSLAVDTSGHSFINKRSQRAALHIRHAIELLRSPKIYGDYAQYGTALEYYATMLSESSPKRWRITPGDLRYTEQEDFSTRCCAETLQGDLVDPFAYISRRILADSISSFTPDLIGISLAYRSQLIPGLALISHINTTIPGISLIIGGSLLSTLPESILKLVREHVHQVIIGPGENAVLAYAGTDTSWPGHYSGIPDFSGFDLHGYFSPGPVIPYSWSRGCYWNRCAFCMEHIHKFRCIDIREGFTQLESIRNTYRPSMIHFTDNAIPLEILRELAQKPLGIPWYGFVRPESILKDKAFVNDLAENGCTMLQLGMETPVQRLLDIMKKGTHAADYPRILENLNTFGIGSYVYLLFGFPHETDDNRRQSLEFVASHPIDYLNASLFRLPRDADLARNPESYGIRDVKPFSDDSHYRDFMGENEQRKNTRRWLSRHFIRHEKVRKILARTPRFYKSNHAAYFALNQKGIRSGRMIHDESHGTARD